MGIFALGQTRPTMDTMGPLGQARLTMAMGLFGRLEAHYEHYGSLGTG